MPRRTRRVRDKITFTAEMRRNGGVFFFVKYSPYLRTSAVIVISSRTLRTFRALRPLRCQGQAPPISVSTHTNSPSTIAVAPHTW